MAVVAPHQRPHLHASCCCPCRLSPCRASMPSCLSEMLPQMAAISSAPATLPHCPSGTQRWRGSRSRKCCRCCRLRWQGSLGPTGAASAACSAWLLCYCGQLSSGCRCCISSSCTSSTSALPFCCCRQGVRWNGLAPAWAQILSSTPRMAAWAGWSAKQTHSRSYVHWQLPSLRPQQPQQPQQAARQPAALAAATGEELRDPCQLTVPMLQPCS